MKALTIEQLQAKAVYLEQENAKLRSALLDYQVRLGVVKLKEADTDG